MTTATKERTLAGFPLYSMTDQPEICPQCGTRPDVLDEKKHNGNTRQLVNCSECDYTYIVEEE